MHARLFFPLDKKINFVRQAVDGTSSVISVMPSTIGARVNQDFVWANNLIDTRDTTKDESLSCYLLKISSSEADESHFKVMFKITENIIGKVFVLYDDILYCVEIIESRGTNAFRLIISDENKPLFENLTAQFDHLNPSQCTPVNKETMAILISLFGETLNSNFMNDTVDKTTMQKMLMETHETHKKLAIKKINDVINYGVIALENIEANTTVTFYTGTLSKNDKKIDHEYALGVSDLLISAKHYRNYSGFITHAFPVDAPKDDYLVTSLRDYKCTLENKTEWHDKILKPNLAEKAVVFDHKPYAFFVNPEPIQAGSILAWNYGGGYWQQSAPALLTLTGEIVDPDTYVCDKSAYRRTF